MFFIIFGTRSTKHKSTKLENFTCQTCNSQDTSFISGKSKYFSIFWIPLFPLGKSATTYCSDCQTSSSAKFLKPELKPKRPIWHFTGIMLFIAFEIGNTIFILSQNMHLLN